MSYLSTDWQYPRVLALLAQFTVHVDPADFVDELLAERNQQGPRGSMLALLQSLPSVFKHVVPFKIRYQILVAFFTGTDIDREINAANSVAGSTNPHRTLLLSLLGLKIDPQIVWNTQVLLWGVAWRLGLKLLRTYPPVTNISPFGSTTLLQFRKNPLMFPISIVPCF